MSAPKRPGPVQRVVLILIAGAAIAVPAFLVSHPATPPAVAHGRKVVPPRRVVPAAEIPAVAPVELVDLTPEEARAYNADVPFFDGPNPAARPFRLRGAAIDVARATDCLAAAELYEAGNDPAGQRAVAQVVLNRVRHPAFPKTICGVVFEGQERRTGCQFTFSCDGALTRWSPPPAMWTRARAIATAALTGTVDRKVGYATHYHTDWVVPYWQSSLDKIARVGPHLFFRWAGWWGTPGAFNRQVAATEPVIEKLAAVSDAHRTRAVADEVQTAQEEAAAVLAASAPGAAIAPGAALAVGTVPAAAAGETDSFLVTLPAGTAPEAYPALAATTCGTRPHCKYLGWTDAKAVPKPGHAPDATQLAAMAFSYLRDRPAGLERTLWNCTLYPRTRPGGCMRRQPTDAAAGKPVSAPSAIGRGPADLSGVRRATSPSPAAAAGGGAG